MDPFRQYIIGCEYGVPGVAEAVEKTVVTDFESFCELHLRDLVSKWKAAGHEIPRLAKAWIAEQSPLRQDSKSESKVADLQSELNSVRERLSNLTIQQTDHWRSEAHGAARSD